MKKIVLILLSFLVFFVVLASNTKDTLVSTTGSELFDSDKIHEIRISFLQCAPWDSLINHKELRDSLNIKQYLQGNVQVNNKIYYSVGIRIKGESSYDYYPGRKKSFKINFGEFVKKQKVDGLKTINLNNAFRDPSFMREKLYLDFLRSEGLPAPRTSYANVYVNNEHYGLYVLVEEINKAFVQTNFGNKNGAFFKGEPKANLHYLGDKVSDYQRAYRLKSDHLNHYYELIDLIRTIEMCTQLNQRAIKHLENSFNITDCLKVFAITSLFMNVDAINLLYQHNYYLYQNSSNSNKFEWIPYDGNYAFCAFSKEFTMKQAENLSVYYISDGFDNPLLKTLFGIKKFRDIYTDYLQELLKEKFTADKIEEDIDRLAIKIRKHVYRDTLKMYTNNEFEQNLNTHIGNEKDPGAFVPGLKSFIQNRISAVKQELNSTVTQKD